MLFTSSPPPSLSLRSSPLPIISHNSLLVIKHHDICIPAKCHACGAKTWISHLLTPVLRFVTPGGNAWAITALNDTFWKILLFKETRTKERLSANSLYLVGKSMFLCVPLFVLDGTLCNIFGSLPNVFGHLRILPDPTKNLGTLKIKNVTPINVKKLAGIHLKSARAIEVVFRGRLIF